MTTLLLVPRQYMTKAGTFTIPRRYAGLVLPEAKALKIIAKYIPVYPGVGRKKRPKP